MNAPTSTSPKKANPIAVGLVGCLGLFAILFVIGVIVIALSGHNSALDHKAVADESQAAKVAGGFDAETKKLYHNGLQHVSHQHQKPGQFTIAQVIDQERSREASRAEAAKAQRDDALYRKAFAELKSGQEASNRILGSNVYTGYKADELGVHIIIDGNYYEYMSQQDQHRFNHLAVTLWGLALRNLYGHEVPFERRRVLLENEAGDELYHDVVGQPTSRENH
jgi:hypothetical protein